MCIPTTTALLWLCVFCVLVGGPDLSRFDAGHVMRRGSLSQGITAQVHAKWPHTSRGLCAFKGTAEGCAGVAMVKQRPSTAHRLEFTLNCHSHCLFLLFFFCHRWMTCVLTWERHLMTWRDPSAWRCGTRCWTGAGALWLRLSQTTRTPRYFWSSTGNTLPY